MTYTSYPLFPPEVINKALKTDLTIRRENKKGEIPEYNVFLRGEKVARIFKSGTHLDHYPWNWYLEEKPRPDRERRSTGNAATYKEAKDCVAYALGFSSWDTK